MAFFMIFSYNLIINFIGRIIARIFLSLHGNMYFWLIGEEIQDSTRQGYRYVGRFNLLNRYYHNDSAARHIGYYDSV